MDYHNTMQYLTQIKDVCINEDELYKKYMVGKESKLSGIRNEKLVKKMQVSDDLQKKSLSKKRFQIIFYIILFYIDSTRLPKRLQQIKTKEASTAEGTIRNSVENLNNNKKKSELLQINHLVKLKDSMDTQDVNPIIEKLNNELISI